MRRRRFLAMVGGVGGGLTGCISGQGRTAPGTAASLENVTGTDGRPGNICKRDPQPGRIPAIIDPAFAPDWTEIGPDLGDEGTIVGLERAGKARAYPLSVLRFEIVNDRFEGPVLVTYCPLCSSGLTAKRTVDGQPTVFANTSYTWRPPTEPGETAIQQDRVFGLSGRDTTRPTNDPNLVMFDRATGSYWSQLLAQAICGPVTGQTLRLIPSTVTTWGNWRAAHDNPQVLLPPPHSETITG